MELSRLVMKLALRHVPKDREEWARAMQAEFDVLKKGRLTWAIGCLGTSLNWDLRAHALYWLAVPISIILATHVFEAPFFWWIAAHCPVHSQWYCRYASYLWGNLALLIACMILGFWRPGRIVSTAITMSVCNVVEAYLFFFFFMHMPLGGYIHFMDLPPVIGETVVLTGALIAVTTGALIGQGARRTVLKRL